MRTYFFVFTFSLRRGAASDLPILKIFISFLPEEVLKDFGIVASSVLSVDALVAVLLRFDHAAGARQTNLVRLAAFSEIIFKRRDANDGDRQELVD